MKVLHAYAGFLVAHDFNPELVLRPNVKRPIKVEDFEHLKAAEAKRQHRNAKSLKHQKLYTP